MFLTRATRMSAALGPALKSPLPFLPRVKANRLRHVTLTLRKGHTFQRYRSLCVTAGGGDSTLAHLEKQQQPDPLWTRDSSGFTATERARLSRLTPAAASLSRRQLAEGGDSGVFRWRGGGGGAEAAAAAQVLFLSSPAVSCRRIIGGTMQPRRDASTTATAAAKKPDAGEQRTSDGNKEEEQSLKEATTSSSSTATGEPEPEGGKPSKTQQLKKVFKEYGAVGVSFHIGISLMSLGMFYLLISSGMDMVAVLSKLGFSDAIIQSRIAAGTSTFVLAYAIHKLFAPVRISITLVSVPLIVRYFRKTGLFKPPTPSP